MSHDPLEACGGRPCFHASNTRLDVGSVLVARSTHASVRLKQLSEREFERLRPKNKPSRINTWFMGNTADEIADLGAPGRKYLYLVEPAASLHKGDPMWLYSATMIQWSRSPRQNRNSIAEAARSYWASRPYNPTVTDLAYQFKVPITRREWMKHRRFEFHTDSVRILGLLPT